MEKAQFISIILLYLIYIYIFFALCTIVYWFVLTRALGRSQDNYDSGHTPHNIAISVIIASRNNLQSLQQNLIYILDQNYTDFELIVVDDESEDETISWLQAFKKKYSERAIKVLRHKKTSLGKKSALSRGIRMAESDYLLLTDADCRPASAQWMRTMQSVMDDHTDVVIGYSPSKKTSGLLNAFQRWDTFFVGIQYLAWAIMGRAYMAVGRNLLYRRSLFDRAGGFDDHKHITGGDDDLFIQQIAGQSKIDVCLHPDSFVYTTGSDRWISFLRQKSRHISTSPHYRWIDIILLSMYPVSQFLFYLLGVYLLLYLPFWVLAIWTIRMAIMMITVRSGLFRLGENALLYYVPILDILQAFYYPILSVYSLFRKKNQW